MVIKNDYEWLAKELMELEEVPSISWHEDAIGNVMKRKLSRKVDNVFFDDFTPAPNLVAEKKGTSGKYKIAIDYHSDQIGFEVKKIDTDGTIYVRDAGGLYDGETLGKEFSIQTPNGPVIATAEKTKQYLKDAKESLRKYVIKYHDAENKKIRKTRNEVFDALQDVSDYVLKVKDADTAGKVKALGVAPKQQAVYAAKPCREEGSCRVVGPAIDDRVGATEALENAKYVAKRGGVKSDLLYVGSAQEEIWLYGAKHVARTAAVGFDIAIAVDDTETDSTTKQGGGPVLITGKGRVKKTMSDPKAEYLLEEAARREGVKLQKQTADYPCTDAYRYNQEGIPAITLAVPVDYGHSNHEIVDLRDVAATIKVLNRAVTDAEEILDSYQRMNESKTYQPVLATKIKGAKR